MSFIELVFPGPPGAPKWVPDIFHAGGEDLPELVITQAREIIGPLPNGTGIVAAPGLASPGLSLTETADRLRSTTKPIFVVTPNAVQLGEWLVAEGVSRDRFRVHCVQACGKPFSARISLGGHLLAFTEAGGRPSVYNTFEYVL